MTGNQKLRALIEAAVMVALAAVLNMIVVYRAPQGGSVTAASMLPILLVGLRWGLPWGLGAGLVFGLIDFITGGIGLSPLAIFLDYFAAFTVFGFAGLFRGKKYGIFFSVVLCALLRFAAHYISGIVVWGIYAPEGIPAWYYSLTYNGGYMLPEMIITFVAAAAVYVPLKKAKILIEE